MSQPTTYAGDAIADWEAAVEAKMTSRAGTTKAQAISMLAREQPALHQAYIQQFNDRHAQRERDRGHRR